MNLFHSLKRAAFCAALAVAAYAPRCAEGIDATTPNDPWPDALEPFRLSTEESVARGLAWLAAAQGADGHMQRDGWGNNTGVIGLCGKAMLAAGITPDHPVYGRHVTRYAEFILNSQRADGLLWRDGADTVMGHAFMYAHAIATAFLSECSGMVDDQLQQRIDVVLPKALAVILRAQNQAGGWKYQPVPGTADLSVSAWNLLALRIARSNGAPIPNESIERGVRYVLSCRSRTGGFGYTGPGDAPAMTGAGVLCLMLTGRQEDPLLRRSGDIILASTLAGGWVAPGGGANMPGRGEYTLYHCTLAMFQLGGDPWEKYARKIIPGIIARQGRDGGWGGNAYGTAMHLLCLTAPFGQSPMHQR